MDGGFVKDVLQFGLPIGVQTVAITLSNVAVQYQVDLLGVQAVAAFAIYLKVELPIYFVILAIGQATTTFVAQNHGAGWHARCSGGIRVCQGLCLALAVIMSVLMLALGHPAFWLFDRDEAVIALGLTMIWTTFPLYFFYAILEVQADAMRGFGHSLGPAFVVLANICVLRVILVFWVAAHGMGLQAIAVTYPITWASTAVCMIVLRLVLTRTRKHLQMH
jgi:Na+-driven multidrug efflux pump